MYFRILSSTFFLMTTAASAHFVIDGLDTLDETQTVNVYRALLNPKHAVENAQVLQADFDIHLKGKNVKAYWIPPTLYQAAQALYDVDYYDPFDEYFTAPSYHGPNPFQKHLDSDFAKFHQLDEPKVGTFTVAAQWARFNQIALGLFKNDIKLLKENPKKVNFKKTLLDVLRTGAGYNAKNERRGHKTFAGKLEKITYTGRTGARVLSDNTDLLSHFIDVETEAHRSGKILLWRYALSIPGGIPDLPFEITNNNLAETLKSPLNPYEYLGNKISFGTNPLDSFVGRGQITGKSYQRWGLDNDCPFNFLVNDRTVTANKEKVHPAMLYTLALSPEKVLQLMEGKQLYNPSPKFMHPFVGIYGRGGDTHPFWSLNHEKSENVLPWLELMSSDALQVHVLNGKVQPDYRNNPESVAFKKIYGEFLVKAKAQYAAKKKASPPVKAKPKAPAAPKKVTPAPKAPASKVVVKPKATVDQANKVVVVNAPAAPKKVASAPKAPASKVVVKPKAAVDQANKVVVVNAPAAPKKVAPAPKAPASKVVVKPNATVDQVKKVVVVNAPAAPKKVIPAPKVVAKPMEKGPATVVTKTVAPVKAPVAPKKASGAPVKPVAQKK